MVLPLLSGRPQTSRRLCKSEDYCQLILGMAGEAYKSWVDESYTHLSTTNGNSRGILANPALVEESTGIRIRIWLWFFTLVSLCIQAEVGAMSSYRSSWTDWSRTYRLLLPSQTNDTVVMAVWACRSCVALSGISRSVLTSQLSALQIQQCLPLRVFPIVLLLPVRCIIPVSYTHLTLPTIVLV